MTLVPPYKVYLESEVGSYTSLAKGRAFLITGILSPVSMLSFTIHDPVNKARSQGIEVISGISMTSPGTRSIESSS